MSFAQDISEEEKKRLIEKYRAKNEQSTVKENEISQAEKQRLLAKYNAKYSETIKEKEIIEVVIPNRKEAAEKKSKLREKQNNSIILTRSRDRNSNIKSYELKTTNTVEETYTGNSKITVKYFYGKQDTLYKEFQYNGK